MITAQWLYGLAGCLIMATGLYAAVMHSSLIKRVIALNIMGSGVFLILIAIAYRGPSSAPDPVPHALVLTGIVVAVSATALALALIRRLKGEQADD